MKHRAEDKLFIERTALGVVIQQYTGDIMGSEFKTLVLTDAEARRLELALNAMFSRDVKEGNL